MMETKAKWKYGKDIRFDAPNRKVNVIFLHCSASDNAQHDDVSVMRNWHVNGNGWSDVGYHYFVTKSGDIQEGRSIEKVPSAQKGYNKSSIAICCHGLKKVKFTEEQMISVKALCKAIADSYIEKIRIRGHREVSSKSCPVYDYKKTLGLNERGYYTNTSSPAILPIPQIRKPKVDVKNITPGSKVNVIRVTDANVLVVALQNLLGKLGFPCLADGVFGQQTKATVQIFQSRHGLKKDGVVGRKTVAAMFSSSKVILKIGNRGFDVQVLQLLLGMHGRNVIHDGIFGKGTKSDLVIVQKSVRVLADGVFGQKSLQAMA